MCLKIQGGKILDNIRIAIATRGYRGVEDRVSRVFGKTKTFTIVDIKNSEYKNVRIVDNPGAIYNQGSGPIASKALAEFRVDLVIASQLGPGASELLKSHKVDTFLTEGDSTVAEAIEEALSQLSNKKT
jgi:predicted Fe-Mo cluster-binding NifX family protein